MTFGCSWDGTWSGLALRAKPRWFNHIFTGGWPHSPSDIPSTLGRSSGLCFFLGVTGFEVNFSEGSDLASTDGIILVLPHVAPGKGSARTSWLTQGISVYRFYWFQGTEAGKLKLNIRHFCSLNALQPLLLTGSRFPPLAQHLRPLSFDFSSPLNPCSLYKECCSYFFNFLFSC